MILERGDMWSMFGKTGLFLITTNPIVRKDGAVVMGRGIAKQAALRFPELPFRFAERLRSIKRTPYVNTIGSFDGQMIGFFMVKDHWKSPAKLDIISASVKALTEISMMKGVCGGYKAGDLRIDLNFPGIGNGKLSREIVLPIMQTLPDNVHVWEYNNNKE